MFNKRGKINDVLKIDVFNNRKFKRYLGLLVGVLLEALAFNYFLLPNKILAGFSGLAIILNNFLQIDVALILFILTILLLIIGIFVLDEEKIRMTILGALLYPFFIKITEPLTSYLVFDNSDVLLSVLFGGVLFGIGSGLIFKGGFSTGGIDTLVQIMNKYLKIPLSKSYFITNFIIITIGILVFGINLLLYSLIFLYISSILMDKIILGTSSSKVFYIITNHEVEIKAYIMKKINCGVTEIEAKGGFSNEKKKILMCIVPTKDYFRLHEAINIIDKDAILLVTDVYQCNIEKEGGCYEFNKNA